MQGHRNGGNDMWMNIPVLLIMAVVLLIMASQCSLWAVAQEAGGNSFIDLLDTSLCIRLYTLLSTSGFNLMDLYVVTGFFCGF